MAWEQADTTWQEEVKATGEEEEKMTWKQVDSI